MTRLLRRARLGTPWRGPIQNSDTRKAQTRSPQPAKSDRMRNQAITPGNTLNLGKTSTSLSFRVHSGQVLDLRPVVPNRDQYQLSCTSAAGRSSVCPWAGKREGLITLLTKKSVAVKLSPRVLASRLLFVVISTCENIGVVVCPSPLTRVLSN